MGKVLLKVVAKKLSDYGESKGLLPEKQCGLRTDRSTTDIMFVVRSVQLTSSRVRLGQSFKTVGYGSASCWGDLGAGSVEADVFYIPFIVSVQYIGY